jgi:hypothetical protein
MSFMLWAVAFVRTGSHGDIGPYPSLFKDTGSEQSVSLPQTPNTSNGVGRVQTLVSIFFAGTGE